MEKKSLLIDEVTGEQFCSKCGYVISEKVNESGPERKSFSTQGGMDNSRTGSPTSLTRHDKGLGSVKLTGARHNTKSRSSKDY